MRILSDNAITKTDLDAIDAKQARQIIMLRWAVGISFAVNVALTLGLKYVA